MATTAEIHRQMSDAWNRRDFAAIRNLLHDEYIYTGGDGQPHSGPDAGMAIAQGYAGAFGDGRLEVRKVYTQGDTAIAEMVARGTHTGDLMGLAPTGRSVELTICNIIELRDGKIYREREYMDMLTLMAQLGVATTPGRAAGA